jgi:hypothetical protein
MKQQVRLKPITIGKFKSWGDLEDLLKKIPDENKQGPIVGVDSGGSETFFSKLRVGKFDDIYLYEGS